MNFPFMNQPFYPVETIKFYEDNLETITTQALNKAQKETGDGAASLLSTIAYDKLKKFGLVGRPAPDVLYPTGFPTVDYLNGYIADQFNKENGQIEKYFNLGITDGSYVCLVSLSGVGKSTFANQIAGNIVRPFSKGMVFIEDAESGMTDQHRRDLSNFSLDEFKRRYVVRNSNIFVENVYKRIKEFAKIKIENKEEFMYDTGLNDIDGNPVIKLQPTVWIIDSIGTLMTEKFIESTDTTNTWGAQIAAVISQAFQGFIQFLKEANIILIGINHFAQDVQMTMFPTPPDVPWLKQGERIPKGKKVTLLANNIFRLDNASKLKKDEGLKIEGSIVRFSIVKSRTSGIKRPIKLVFDYASGYDPMLSMLEYLRDNNLLYGGGASFSFDPEKMFKFSLGTFRDKVNNDKEFREAFMKHMLPILETIPVDIYKPSNSDAYNLSGFYPKRVSR